MTFLHNTQETQEAVPAENEFRKKTGINPEPFLLRKEKQTFSYISLLDSKTMMGDQDRFAQNLYAYIHRSVLRRRCS